MSDNSPDYEALASHYEVVQNVDAEQRAELCQSFRAAAALARENERVRSHLNICGVSDERMRGNISTGLDVLVTRMTRQVDSAESANRALQAEVDRLRSAVEQKNASLRKVSQGIRLTDLLHAGLGIDEVETAIAYTGTEPQAK